MMRRIALAGAVCSAPFGAAAHQLVVFASVDCKAVHVEAKFSSGRIAKQGEVRILDGQNELLKTTELSEDGMVSLPLDGLDHSEGLVIEVDTNGHENYWIVTPQDIALACGT